MYGEHLRNRCWVVPTSSYVYIAVYLYLYLFGEYHLFSVIFVVLVFNHPCFTLSICEREYEKENKGMIWRITFTHCTLLPKQLENWTNFFISNWICNFEAIGMWASVLKVKLEVEILKQTLCQPLAVRPEEVPCVKPLVKEKLIAYLFATPFILP